MVPTNSTTNNTTVNRIYNGQLVELDATQNPDKTTSTTDPDGTTTFTYAWRQVTASGGTARRAANPAESATRVLVFPAAAVPNL